MQDKDNFMKKVIIAAALAAMFPQTGQAADDSFYEDILINDELKAQEEKKQAENAAKAEIRKIGQEAGKLLETTAPTIEINLQELEKISSSSREQKRTTTDNLSPAPFGLYWGATILDTQNADVSLVRIDEKDYPDSYSATDLPKGIRDFNKVYLSFGIENALWRIIAYSTPEKDTPSAEYGLRLYQRFYKMLERKYGNTKEYFTPRPVNKEQTYKDAHLSSPDTSIGNPNFLSDLQIGGAELYSTFENEEVIAALTLNVDGSGQSYIVIEYKNKRIMQSREDETYDAL